MSRFITADLPGTGGRLRQAPEDFVVTEIPAYEPCGEGTHAYFEVTKRDLTTRHLVDHLARATAVRSTDIGYAGQKDRHAVTTQRLSVPAPAEGVPAALDGMVEVLAWRPLGLHENKLRKGHLHGNLFRIRIRDPQPGAAERARQVARRLEQTGWPNFFGPQRFGREGDNAEGGRELLANPRQRMPRWKRDLLVAAYQSELFNRYLARRIDEGLFSRALCGDLMGKLPGGGLFICQEPDEDQPRMDRFEISPTGPIFGYKMRRSEGAAAALEAQLQVDLAGFKPVGAQGSRRRLRLPLSDFRLEEEAEGLILEFSLPSGSYATVLLGEFMKC